MTPHNLTLEQQIWLAKQLPDVIKTLLAGENVNHLIRTTITRFYWIGAEGKSWKEVTPHEWHSIVAMVEETLRQSQFYYVGYWKELFKVVTGIEWDGKNLGYFGRLSHHDK